MRGSRKSSIRVSPRSLERSSKKSLIRHLLSPKIDEEKEENNIPVETKSWVIRVACGQIVRALDDISDALSHQLLQELCAELVVRSSSVIQRKVDKSNKSSTEMDNTHVQIAPSKKIGAVESKEAFLTNDVQRKAEMVENRVTPPSLPAAKSSVEDPFAMFPNDTQHTLYTYLTDNNASYLAFKRADANIPFFFLFYLSAFFFVITGFVWSHDVMIYQEHPTATISIVCAVVAAISLLWIGFNHVVSLMGQYQFVCLRWYHKFVMKLYRSSFRQWPDNCACLFVALASGFYLVNIVMMNLCHTTTNFNNNIVCLPTNVPPESIIMTMLIVIMVQIVAPGVSRIALICSWFFSITAINVSIYMSGNSNYVWINVLLILIMGMSYELERQPLRQFNKMTKTMEAVRVAAELQLQCSTYKILLASEALESKRSLVSELFHYISYFIKTHLIPLISTCLTCFTLNVLGWDDIITF